MKYLSTLFALLFLAGCMHQNSHQFEEHLKIGTTPKTSVEKTLGTPVQKEVASNGYECWYYDLKQKPSKIKVLSTVPQVISDQNPKTAKVNYDLKVFFYPQGILWDYEYIERNL